MDNTKGFRIIYKISVDLRIEFMAIFFNNLSEGKNVITAWSITSKACFFTPISQIRGA